MSRIGTILLCLFFSLISNFFLFAQSLALETELDFQITGIWENDSRFVEFRPDGKLRIILKPYYGFVYEDTGWVQDSKMPRIQIGDELFIQYYEKKEIPEVKVAPDNTPVNGFWLAQGLTTGIKLYKEENLSYLFGWYFEGSHYYRIRYWKTDVRFKDLDATFTSFNGETLHVPKFLTIEKDLYTCITSTGTILRNYEKGFFSITENEIQFKPDEIVFEGTEAEYRKSIKLTVSPDGQTFALGEPYLVRSPLTDLDAEIAVHNGKRRTLRKPLLEFMDLDFHWEEIESIRNNGVIPD